MRVLIFGNGYIGNRLQQSCHYFMSEKRVISVDDIISEIDKHSADVAINCIGYTGGRNVDGCEVEVERTLMANSFIPIMFAEAAVRTGVKLVHISSGCIYHSKNGMLCEDDDPDFFDLYYSRTKIYAERALSVMSTKNKFLIVRIRIPLDYIPHRRNLLTKLLSFNQVLDSPNSVTYLPDFAQALSYLIEIDACGIYNLVNSGELRYPDLLDIYNRYVSHQYSIISSCADIGKVRTDLVLSTRKLEGSGFKVRDINSVLEECVGEYLKIAA